MTQVFAPSRRDLLKWSGAAAGIMVAGSMLPNFGISAALAEDLGSGDVGVLNYAYALEQLEAAFYTQVVANGSFTTIFSALEQEYLKDVRDHEIAHREFFKAAITAAASSQIIPALQVDFSTINFG